MTDLITAKRLAKIRAREGIASSGPWFEFRRSKAGRLFQYSKFPFEVPDDLLAADQDFIKHARTDVPDLAASYERAVELLRECDERMYENRNEFKALGEFLKEFGHE